ncbi:hypothetical protein SCLCIDRAFT_1188115 [Scleroderma citrinum Foug A]|uniref:DUF155 domain-containing protein n=1 Tax=Scleroderma citrinum Foug A TaxID=1036808 RepID=A0A0C3DEL3_9AGAM|nr:hypothetical protein SCLCIDRAFT_1188115 [Scleroderma citrinum Foug A]
MTPRPILPNVTPPTVVGTAQQVEPKIRGANRSTKIAGKLKVLPDQPTTQAPASTPIPKQSKVERPPSEVEEGPSTTVETDDGDDEEEEEMDDDDEEFTEVRLRQISQIPQGTARRDALRLTKKKAKSLPRVTAYATASSYRLNELTKFFHARREAYRTDPKTIDDEVVYTSYSYELSASPDAHMNPKRSSQTGDLLGVPELSPLVSSRHDSPSDVKKIKRSKFYAVPTEAEVYVFSYGTVVIWGMTEAQERRFLSSIRRFEVDRLAPEDVEMEDLNYYYANYSRIYNDVITLRKGSGYMTKLSLSHALSQSAKISLFEALISSKIEETKDIPEILSETGKIAMPHKEIMRKTGELFILRTNINSVGSVLDSPEVFWSYPDLQPLYDAARSYLEIPQRIELLNTRLEVLQDMLQLLKESSSSRYAERLEQIVIALIGIEIGMFSPLRHDY